MPREAEKEVRTVWQAKIEKRADAPRAYVHEGACVCVGGGGGKDFNRNGEREIKGKKTRKERTDPRATLPATLGTVASLLGGLSLESGALDVVLDELLCSDDVRGRPREWLELQ